MPRQIVGSRNVALATAALVQNIVRSVKFSTIDELLALIKAVGRRLVEANPKGEYSSPCISLPHIDRKGLSELSAGNIIRRILRLIREEYRAAAANHLSSAPSSTPGTPFLGPDTPGLAFPSSHYLSSDYTFTKSPPSSSTTLPRQTSLSNFVVMRHSRAQLDRSTVSTLDMSLSASTSSLFTSPTRGSSVDSMNGNGNWGMNGMGMSTGMGAGNGTGMGMMSRADSEEFMKQSSKLKPVLIQAIDEVVGELETTHEDVAKGAKEHVHSS